MKSQSFIVFIFMFALSTVTLSPWASGGIQTSDPFNTYQFNRKNHFKKNYKINRTPWFEWWYYKVVLPEKNKSFYFVYGVVNPWDVTATNEASRSYVGMGAFAQNTTLEQQFRVSDFEASYNTTFVRVGSASQATDTQLVGNIIDPKGGTSRWNISVQKKWAFNATGWMTGKNISKIEWYPAQADARCSGEVIVNDVRESFTDAPCYQDRNWGSLFPKWWAWVVSNHFEEDPETTLAIGGGKPSVVDSHFKIQGVAIGLKHKGHEYSWRPHYGDRVKFQINYGNWEIDAINKKFRIKVSARAPYEKFMDLQFMTPQGLIFHDYETLQGHLRVQLFERSKSGFAWNLMEDLNSKQAGLEYGSYDILDRINLETQMVCLVGCH
jgi:tocopherol cyclase